QIVAHGLEEARWDVHHALFTAIGHALWNSGLLLVHAAVMRREGRTLALVGLSGTGKSTTLAQAVAAGWTPLAADAILRAPRCVPLPATLPSSRAGSAKPSPASSCSGSGSGALPFRSDGRSRRLRGGQTPRAVPGRSARAERADRIGPRPDEPRPVAEGMIAG